jgi:rod shape-determining protein MreD
MADPFRASPQFHWLVYLAFALAILFARLLPLGTTAGDLPGPDLVLCLTFAWAIRRPDFVPVWLLAAVFLTEDLVLMRPPGLWTALVIVAVEFIRSRVALTRELTFPMEWLLVAGLMVGCLLAFRSVAGLLLVPQPAFGFALLQTVWSILCYPLVVGLSQLALDLRKPATGEVDDYGRRL